MARRLRSAVRWIGPVLAVVATSCEATPPTAPSPTVAGVVVLYPQPTRLFTAFQLQAYTVDSDGAYANVTDRAQWSSSNPSVVSVSGGSFIGGQLLLPATPGSAVILATFDGKAAQLPIVVPPRVFTGLQLDLNNTPLIGVGQTLALAARFSDGSRSVDVSATAAWTSSNPSIATVEGGRVVAQAIGTTEIRVSYQGLSDAYMVSVLPADRAR